MKNFKNDDSGGKEFRDRLNELGIPVDWFNAERAEAFMLRNFVLVVDNGMPFPQPPMLVNPRCQFEVLH